MSFHPDQNMPGCMMPDGGECCEGHAAVVTDWHKKRVTCDAAQRAYGILWRDPSVSLYSRGARKELFNALSHEDRRAGIAWAMEAFGPMSDAEMIAADIRIGVFPKKSTEKQR